MQFFMLKTSCYLLALLQIRWKDLQDGESVQSSLATITARLLGDGVCSISDWSNHRSNQLREQKLLMLLTAFEYEGAMSVLLL